MKKFCILYACVVLVGLVSCQKQQTEEERKAEIDREVQQRLAAEHQAEEQQKLSQRKAELDAREKALAEKQNAAATQTPRARSTSSTRTTRDSSEEGPSYNIFYTKLEPYGEWRETSDYGYVWQPREAEHSRSWHPYTNGRWVYTDVGWTWVSEEPFGWATYHYGRWTRLRGIGWVWVPSDEWAPAWVSWRKSDEYVGWAPLPPEARFDRRHGIHNWADNYYDIGPDQYRFVPTREFGTRQIERTVVPRERNVTIINQTTNVTNITYNNTTVVNQGPNYDELRTRSQQPIERLRLEREVNVDLNVEIGRPVVRGAVIAIPAPVIAIGRPVERPRTAKAAIAQTVVEHGWEDIGDRQAAEQARTKMKSESTPPPDAPSKTFVKPAVAPTQPTPAASAATAKSASPAITSTSTPARSRPMTTPAPTEMSSATPASTPEQSVPVTSTETPSPSASPTATPKSKPFATSSPSPTTSPAMIRTRPLKMTPVPTATSSPSISPSVSPIASPSATATISSGQPLRIYEMPGPAVTITPRGRPTPPRAIISPSVSPKEKEETLAEKPKTLGQKRSLAQQLEPIRTVPMSPPASPSATLGASAAPSAVTTPAISPPARSTTTSSPTPKGSATPTPTPTPATE